MPPLLENLMRPDLLDLRPYEGIDPPEVLAARLGIPPERIVKLDGNENPYGPSPAVCQALGSYAGYHIYPDPLQRRLRSALASYAGVQPDQVVAGAGSDELIDLLLRLFLSPGDKVIDLSPSFGMYPFCTKVNGGIVVDVPRDAAWEIDPSAVRRAVDKRTKVVFVANPNNPTGNLTPIEVVLDLAETGILVVVDETYHEFCGFTAVPWLAHYENLVILRTLSKWAGLAGLRLGYGIMSPRIVQRVLAIKAPYNISVAAELAALASLEDTDTLLQRVRTLVEERERMAHALRAIGGVVVYPSKTNFLLVHLPGHRGDAVAAALARRGVLVRTFSHPRLVECVRISVGLPHHTDALVSAMRSILGGK
ncbi:MAG: histidinol-phosphate transaminase [Dehalococcoidia bacterium]|nr:histidinol-phosphate transaminase [Dehalococcoidia bacterium]MDW8119610.1 histidinol-phosphate transaminase [Chloroflexota bacterium]